jgi:hypothetical protein
MHQRRTSLNLAHKWDHLPHKLPVKRALKWVWFRHRNRKINDLLYKLLHRRLPIGANRIWDPDLNVGCPCGDDLETTEHLFFSCAVSRSVWLWFRRVWSATTWHQLPDNLYAALFCSIPPSRIPKHRKGAATLLAIAHPELLYAIWLTRCRWVFDEDPFSALYIINTFRSRIKIAISNTEYLSKLHNFTLLAQRLIAAMDLLP